ncbi:hypothetical protein KKB41_02745 [Patescibacteria group bacterium]|nr:hypothetical protein [Patescibacteria group bacterium]
MMRLKTILLKIVYYLYLPIVWVLSKIERPDKQDEKIVKELVQWKKEDDNKIRQEMAININHLPDFLQASFPPLDLLEFFLATHAIETLILRNLRQARNKNLETDCQFILLSEQGDIFFGESNSPRIPATTTIQEIQRFTRVLDNELTTHLVSWIVESAIYWKTIIPKFEVIETEVKQDGMFFVKLQIANK